MRHADHDAFALRRRIEATIEDLIDTLDLLDAAEDDLEDDDEDEDSDPGETSSDEEPYIAAPEAYEDQTHWAQGDSADGELLDDGEFEVFRQISIEHSKRNYAAKRQVLRRIDAIKARCAGSEAC